MIEELSFSLEVVRETFQLSADCITREALTNELAVIINEMIQKDFSKLLNILYRLDVNEDRLRNAFKSAPVADAATLIANLIIDRQLEKFRSRAQSKQNEDIPEDEKW